MFTMDSCLIFFSTTLGHVRDKLDSSTTARLPLLERCLFPFPPVSSFSLLLLPSFWGGGLFGSGYPSLL